VFVSNTVYEDVRDRLPFVFEDLASSSSKTLPVVPTASDQWVRVVMAMPEQVLAALDCLRSVLTAWEARRPAAASVVNRLESPNLPTAGEYAVALHNAEMLVFASEKLLSLYAGIIYSMPIYRLYPATAEAEAIALWWPWGRSAPLVDGGPPRPPKQRQENPRPIPDHRDPTARRCPRGHAKNRHRPHDGAAYDRGNAGPNAAAGDRGRTPAAPRTQQK
jgi:hypothetical protein